MDRSLDLKVVPDNFSKIINNLSNGNKLEEKIELVKIIASFVIDKIEIRVGLKVDEIYNELCYTTLDRQLNDVTFADKVITKSGWNKQEIGELNYKDFINNDSWDRRNVRGLIIDKIKVSCIS